MAYTQDNRLIAIDTPLGKDALLLAGFHGIEGISGLFSFELNLLSENHNIKFEDIIGKNVTVSIILADGEKRFFNGIISSFSQGRGGGEAGGDPHFSHYAATMVPWFWLLTRTADSRIFQKLSVPDIVEKIFTEKEFLDYKLLLNDSYEKRDYCVQYRETDFNFISRLLEEEGICYFFEHEEKKHTLILADASDKFKPCPKQESARYQISAGGWLEEDVITSLEKMQEIRPAKYTINDFNFEIPSTDMKVDVSTKQMLGPGEREIYDYPGLYTKKARGERLTTIRMEEEETKITTITGSSDCRAFTSGYKFNLTDYYREDMDKKDYVLTHIEHEVREVSDYYGASIESMGSESPYINRFKCIPYDVPYRPSRDTAKPVVRGTQTAIVVGPAGEEIYTDEHGRIKVQFHWDREGKKDENSSCWIRVSQVWAGAGWGAMHIPHIGHEVVVDFIEGDPDRPIITGRVYHGANMPANALPGEKTKSVIRDHGGNHIIMEGEAGKEQIHMLSPYGDTRLSLGAPNLGQGCCIRSDFDLTLNFDRDRFERIGRDLDIQILRNEMRQIQGNLQEQIDGNAAYMIFGDQNSVVRGTVETKYEGLNINIRGGLKQDTFIGGQHQLFIGLHRADYGAGKWEYVAPYKSDTVRGWKKDKVIGTLVTEVIGKIIEKGKATKDSNLDDTVTIDSAVETKIIGGGGPADTSTMVLKGDRVQINCGTSKITIKENGDIEIESQKKLKINAQDDVEVSGKRVIIVANDKTDLKYAPITHKYIKIG